MTPNQRPICPECLNAVEVHWYPSRRQWECDTCGTVVLDVSEVVERAVDLVGEVLDDEVVKERIHDEEANG